VLAVLLFLVCCLTVHFLIEDLVFLSSQPASGSTRVSLDELTHQDDLVLAFNLPAHIPDAWLRFDIPVVLPLQAQSTFPLRHPPKI
jgi:hypothetical protein